MPLTVFDTKGIPAARRERIEAAVEAGGKRINGPYEAWITADPFRGGVRVLITGPFGFERSVLFAVDEDPAEITERVRATLEEWGVGNGLWQAPRWIGSIAPLGDIVLAVGSVHPNRFHVDIRVDIRLLGLDWRSLNYWNKWWALRDDFRTLAAGPDLLPPSLLDEILMLNQQFQWDLDRTSGTLPERTAAIS